MEESVGKVTMKTQKKILCLTIILLSFLSLSACIRIYRPDLRQGNYVTQKKIDQLTVGMSKETVQQIMGSPALIPVLNLPM